MLLNPLRASADGADRIQSSLRCNRHYLDLVEPGFIAFAIRDMGEMALGAVTKSLECDFGKNKRDVSFDEGGQVSDQRWNEMTSSVTITSEVEFQDSDETTLESRRW